MVCILLFLSRVCRRYICLGAGLSVLLTAFGQSENCDSTEQKVVCTVRDSTGYVLEIHRYKNGLKWGSWERFNSKGQVVEKNYFRKDVRIWTFFYRDEEVIKSINKKGKVKKFKGCGCT
jgi:hypothetical protein